MIAPAPDGTPCLAQAVEPAVDLGCQSLDRPERRPRLPASHDHYPTAVVAAAEDDRARGVATVRRRHVNRFLADRVDGVRERIGRRRGNAEWNDDEQDGREDEEPNPCHETILPFGVAITRPGLRFRPN